MEINPIVKALLEGVLTLPKPGPRANQHPYVKVLDPDWRVSDSKSPGIGYTDFGEKVLHVPIDSSLFSERTRFHELSHVKWSNRDGNPAADAERLGVPEAFIQAFEDARLNNRLAAADESFEELLIDAAMDVNAIPDEQIDQIRNAGVVSDTDLQSVMAAMYVCSDRFGEQDGIRPMVDASGLPSKDVDELIQRVAYPDATYDDVLETAVALKQLIERNNLPEQEDPQGSPQEGDGDEEGEDEQEVEAVTGTTPAEPAQEEQKLNNAVIDVMASLPSKPSPMTAKPERYSFVKLAPEGIGDDKTGSIGEILKQKHYGLDSWVRMERPMQAEVEEGVMQVFRPALDIRVVRKMGRPRVPRQDLAGGEIRGLHRLITDEKILRRKAPLRSRKKVGTMLIDASGSMEIEAHDIEMIIGYAPQVTIAVYGSNFLDEKLNEKLDMPYMGVGHLAVIAHKGKRASKLGMYLGGGNVVDTEALRWLHKQPGPRVWICDSGVTGVGDEAGANISFLCGQIAARARVKRFFSIHDFLEASGFDVSDLDEECEPYEPEEEYYEEEASF